MRLRHVVLMGAGGQLGSSLCRLLAARDCRLSLCSLDGDDLEQVVKSLPTRSHSRTTATVLDVRDADALSTWMQSCGKAQPVDWVIVNAGVGGQLEPGEALESASRSIDLVDVNLTGTLNAVNAALPELRRGNHPKLVLISSLSAIIGFDKAPVYAATKAAARILGLSLRPALKNEGINVTVVCPGFLSSPMATQRQGWRPFAVDAEVAARKIIDGVETGRAQICFPFGMVIFVRVLAMMPIPLRELVYRHSGT